MARSNFALSPQCADILANLRSGPRTTLQLQHATGVMAMGPRMHELRAALEPKGLIIETRLIEARNRHHQRCHVAEYTLRRAPGRTRARRVAKKSN